MGARRIVELLQGGGVPVDETVAIGGLAHKKIYRQILADVLQVPIEVSPGLVGPAVGAAMYGASATGLFPRGMAQAVEAMPQRTAPALVVRPSTGNRQLHNSLFTRHMSHARPTPGGRGSGGGAAPGDAPFQHAPCSRARRPRSSPRPGNHDAHEHAVCIHGAHDVRFEAVEPVTAEGAARTGEGLLDAACVGICGSDLHSYEDGLDSLKNVDIKALGAHKGEPATWKDADGKTITNKKDMIAYLRRKHPLDFPEAQAQAGVALVQAGAVPPPVPPPGGQTAVHVRGGAPVQCSRRPRAPAPPPRRTHSAAKPGLNTDFALLGLTAGSFLFYFESTLTTKWGKG
jgi:hypothetical protein